MAEGKITIPPPIGLLETDSYSAKANRVTSATSVTTTFEYTITHADGSQVIQIVQDTNGDREVVETKELPATAASQPLPPGATRVATIVFPNGSARLTARDRQILAQVVALQKEQGGTLHVVGHSSSRTRNLSPEKHRLVNYKVSALRAKTVANELIRRGANRRTVATAALADSQPLYQEIMPNGEAGNRRAEIFLTR